MAAWNELPAEGSSPSRCAELVDAAERLRGGAPELAVQFAARALTSAAVEAATVTRAQELLGTLLVKLGRHAEAVEPGLAALRAVTGGGQVDRAAVLRVALAACARVLGEPLTGCELLRPVLRATGTRPAGRALALGQFVACAAHVGNRDDLEDALAEADRLFAADGDTGQDGRRLERSLLCVRAASYHRRHGDTEAAAESAREGLALLNRMSDAEAEGGLARSRLVLELVCALLDDGDLDEAGRVAAVALGEPVRATSALALGRLRLAIATRVLLPSGRAESGRILLTEVVRVAERHHLDSLLTDAWTFLAHAEEEADHPVEALHALRSARAAEYRYLRAAQSAKSLLVAEVGAVHDPATAVAALRNAVRPVTAVPAKTRPTTPTPAAEEQKPATATSAPLSRRATRGEDTAPSVRAVTDPGTEQDEEPRTTPLTGTAPATPSRPRNDSGAIARRAKRDSDSAATPAVPGTPASASARTRDSAVVSRRAERATGPEAPTRARTSASGATSRRVITEPAPDGETFAVTLVRVGPKGVAEPIEPEEPPLPVGGEVSLNALAIHVRALAPANAELLRSDRGEFAVLLPDTSLDTADRLATAIRETATEAQWLIDDHGQELTITTGTAAAPGTPDGPTTGIDALLAAARRAMAVPEQLTPAPAVLRRTDRLDRTPTTAKTVPLDPDTPTPQPTTPPPAPTTAATTPTAPSNSATGTHTAQTTPHAPTSTPTTDAAHAAAAPIALPGPATGAHAAPASPLTTDAATGTHAAPAAQTTPHASTPTPIADAARTAATPLSAPVAASGAHAAPVPRATSTPTSAPGAATGTHAAQATSHASTSTPIADAAQAAHTASALGAATGAHAVPAAQATSHASTSTPIADVAQAGHAASALGAATGAHAVPASRAASFASAPTAVDAMLATPVVTGAHDASASRATADAVPAAPMEPAIGAHTASASHTTSPASTSAPTTDAAAHAAGPDRGSGAFGHTGEHKRSHPAAPPGGDLADVAVPDTPTDAAPLGHADQPAHTATPGSAANFASGAHRIPAGETPGVFGPQANPESDGGRRTHRSGAFSREIDAAQVRRLTGGVRREKPVEPRPSGIEAILEGKETTASRELRDSGSWTRLTPEDSAPVWPQDSGSFRRPVPQADNAETTPDPSAPVGRRAARRAKAEEPVEKSTSDEPTAGAQAVLSRFGVTAEGGGRRRAPEDDDYYYDPNALVGTDLPSPPMLPAASLAPDSDLWSEDDTTPIPADTVRAQDSGLLPRIPAPALPLDQFFLNSQPQPPKPDDVPTPPDRPVPDPSQPTPTGPDPFQPEPDRPDPFRPDPPRSGPARLDSTRSGPLRPEPGGLDSFPSDPTRSDPFRSDSSQPDPFRPELGQLDPARFGPTRPDPAEPDPGHPEPTRPDPFRSDPTRSDPSRSGPAQPDPFRSDPTRSDPAQPGPGRSDPFQPDPFQPEPGQPDPFRPDPTRPDPDQPDPFQPDPFRPDPTRPDPDQPDPFQPDPFQPEPGQPDPFRPDPFQPEPGHPDPFRPDPFRSDPTTPGPLRPEVPEPPHRPEIPEPPLTPAIPDPHNPPLKRDTGSIGAGSVDSSASVAADRLASDFAARLRGLPRNSGVIDKAEDEFPEPVDLDRPALSADEPADRPALPARRRRSPGSPGSRRERTNPSGLADLLAEALVAFQATQSNQGWADEREPDPPRRPADGSTWATDARAAEPGERETRRADLSGLPTPPAGLRGRHRSSEWAPADLDHG
ncbi:hypothetical protein V5P93_001381 [Actinokineospora auranticolor]|uniref:GGDEF domain-containing protein n=1 Tax=Actinokineospora auranticolor TaxID=155976 RepID=A0A2S6GUZ0_9PSEU|nr:hypothetical protein [Actinokineospora auranticolor]PPK69007.1 hypothetical protein CLV40_104255 [Actinokineospora auranticolor]